MITKISQIAAHYLEEQTRLIIPDVGTLLRRKESGEIVLVPMLRKSDGVLVGLVAEQLEVDADEATRLVAAYSEAILDSLAKSKKFILDGIGVLLINPKGALEFAFNPLSRTIPAATESAYEEAPRAFEPVAEEPASTEEESAQPQVVVEEELKVVDDQPVIVELSAEPAAEELEEEPAAEEPAVEEPAAKAATYGCPPTKPIGLSWGEAERSEKEDESEESRRRVRIATHLKRKKIDMVTVVAILAVILAVISLIWGLTPTKMELDVDALGGEPELIEEMME